MKATGKWASDLALSTQPEDTPGAFAGASIDFKAAHKQVQVRPEEHGLLLFAFQGKLYHYRVCHFGGRFSAFWWQRTGAFLLRQVHGLLAWKPHKAFLFVDDLLCALFRNSAPDMFALVVLFFSAIAAPISWKKAQFQDSLVWCGWETNFSHDTIQLVSAKLAKLDALIKSLVGNRRVPRKTLEQCTADLGHQHCPTPQVLASTAVRGPQQPTRLHALNTAANVVGL